MSYFKRMEEIIESYGLKPAHTPEGLEAELKDYIEDNKRSSTLITYDIFLGDVLYVLASGHISEKIRVEDFNLFKKKFKKGDVWGTEEEWLVKDLVVQYNFYEEGYVAEVVRISKKFDEIDVGTPRIKEFLKKHLTEEKFLELELKSLFSDVDTKKVLRPILLKKWEELADEISDSPVIKSLQQELTNVIGQMYVEEIKEHPGLLVEE